MHSFGNRLGGSLSRSLLASRWSAVLVGVLVLLWLPVAAAGGPEQVPWWYHTFGLSRDGFLAGQAWQPLSYGFLHGSTVHLLLNAVVLVLIGGRVEHILGGGPALRIFLLGVLGGGGVHLLLVPGGTDTPILVGASGGAMAWLLTLTTLSPESRMWPLPVSARNLGIGLLLASALLAAVNPALGVPGLAAVGRLAESLGLGSIGAIGHACHLGGGIAGWVAGRWILRPRISLESLRRQRELREQRQNAAAAGRPRGG